MWLRIPLTLLMGAKRKTKVLMLGVLISGIFYDALYVIFGAVVGKVFTLNSVQMVIIFTGGLTVLYIGTFVVQQIVSRLKNKKKKTPPPI
jgi:membrane-associated protein